MAVRHRQQPVPASAVEIWTSAPAFVTNERLEIINWNDAAQRLLGFEAGEVLGKTCADVTGCPGRGGQMLCFHASCAHDHTERAEKALPVYDRFVRRKDGKVLAASICTVLVRSPEGPPLLLHLLRDATRETQLENALKDIAALARSGTRDAAGEEVEPSTAAPAALLTHRELEVLRLLRAGADTAETASALFVSPATVRNHIQSVFRKLHAHSRLEAVSLAVKNGLL